MKSFAKDTLLFCLSIIVAFLIAEGLVRTFATVRNVGPSFTEFDKDYGKKLKKNFETLENVNIG